MFNDASFAQGTSIPRNLARNTVAYSFDLLQN